MLNKHNRHWLAGFIEANGNFQIFKKKVVNTKGIITHYGVGVGFHLALHIRDYALLEEIQTWLGGIGKLYRYEHKNEAHYAITSLDHLKSLIEQVLEPIPFFCTRQSQRAQLLKHCVLNGIRRVETVEQFEMLLAMAPTFAVAFATEGFRYPYSRDLFDAHILGFINGHGCFTDVTRYSGGKFSLEHSDENMVDLVRRALFLSTTPYAPTVRGKQKQTYAFNVTTYADLTSVYDFIERNAATTPLRGNKAVQYQNWYTKKVKEANKLLEAQQS